MSTEDCFWVFGPLLVTVALAIVVAVVWTIRDERRLRAGCFEVLSDYRLEPKHEQG